MEQVTAAVSSRFFDLRETRLRDVNAALHAPDLSESSSSPIPTGPQCRGRRERAGEGHR